MHYLNILLDIVIICLTIVVLVYILINNFNIHSVSLYIQLIKLIIEVFKDLRNNLTN